MENGKGVNLVSMLADGKYHYLVCPCEGIWLYGILGNGLLDLKILDVNTLEVLKDWKEMSLVSPELLIERIEELVESYKCDFKHILPTIEMLDNALIDSNMYTLALAMTAVQASGK